MRAINGLEMARILENNGWRLIRVHGSHHLYGLGAMRIVVPIHGSKTLKSGLQRDLMKQAGLTDDDL